METKDQAEKIDKSIAKVLNDEPSKSGGKGSNLPDIMLILNDNKDNRHIPVMIEAKGSKNRLEKIASDGTIVQTVSWNSDSKEGVKHPHKKGDPNNAAIVNYAVNGAYHYAKAIINRTDYNEVIFIGVNATKLDDKNIPIDPEQKAYY